MFTHEITLTWMHTGAVTLVAFTKGGLRYNTRVRSPKHASALEKAGGRAVERRS